MHDKNMLKKATLSIKLTLTAVTISSLSLSLIPFISGGTNGSNNTLSYLVAAIFWIGILTTIVEVCSTKKTLFRLREKLIVKGHIKGRQSIGAISFSGNRKMWILYGITLVGLVMIITDIIFNYVPETIMFFIISLTLLLFSIHCVVDGKYFKVYAIIKESIRNDEQH